jgi:hypothetical protein
MSCYTHKEIFIFKHFSPKFIINDIYVMFTYFFTNFPKFQFFLKNESCRFSASWFCAPWLVIVLVLFPHSSFNIDGSDHVGSCVSQDATHNNWLVGILCTYIRITQYKLFSVILWTYKVLTSSTNYQLTHHISTDKSQLYDVT